MDARSSAEPSLPSVTVAIPVYRRLQFLEGALRSVAAQDYPNRAVRVIVPSVSR